MKYCTNCGAEISQDAKFCTKCGHSTKQLDTNRGHKSNPKTIFAFITIICVVLCVVLGAVFYSGYKERKEAELMRQKKEMLIPMEVVLDLYKSKDGSYVKSKLDEYGYEFFIADEYSEYFSKNVELKGVEDWKGDMYYEPTHRKGSRVSLSRSEDSFYFEITVFSKEDFAAWVKQLENLGYKEESYGENLPMEDGWTALGAHGNLCKLYSDGNGHSIEFMKDGDGHVGYTVYLTELD